MSRPILTISILSTTGREQYLSSMLFALSSQIANCDHNVVVQVIMDKPTIKGGLSIGGKRNLALQNATGIYHAFIDCDDTIWHDYISKQVQGCLMGCDCVSFMGNYYEDHKFKKPFIHSIKYNEYSEDDKYYYRFPNHLNAIKTDIAKMFLFDEINHGEDTKYAIALHESGLLKSEAKLDGIIYDYYFRNNKKELL
jgi:hypothetical protein